MRILRRLAAVLVALGLLCVGLLTRNEKASAFGTINGNGQNAEHEQITRAALGCRAGTRNKGGECFDPLTLDELAGTFGRFGAVGRPDITDPFTAAAHCDGADFFNITAPSTRIAGVQVVTRYRQTREEATTALRNCAIWMEDSFNRALTRAGELATETTINRAETIIVAEGEYETAYCGVLTAKCQVLRDLGRLLHTTQDFYAHSNWTDAAVDTKQKNSFINPPALKKEYPSPLSDRRLDRNELANLSDLSTGYFQLGRDDCEEPGDATVSVSLNLKETVLTKVVAIRHACMNKDEFDSGDGLDPDNPNVIGGTIRGKLGDNASRAVRAAIQDSARQWSDFRSALVTTYGAQRGGLIARAIAQDMQTVEIIVPSSSGLRELTYSVDGAASLRCPLTGCSFVAPLGSMLTLQAAGTDSSRPVFWACTDTAGDSVLTSPTTATVSDDVQCTPKSATVTFARIEFFYVIGTPMSYSWGDGCETIGSTSPFVWANQQVYSLIKRCWVYSDPSEPEVTLASVNKLPPLQQVAWKDENGELFCYKDDADRIAVPAGGSYRQVYGFSEEGNSCEPTLG